MPDSPCTSDCVNFRKWLQGSDMVNRRVVRIKFAFYGELQEYFDDPYASATAGLPVTSGSFQ
jgi:hypothetical protein